MLDETKLWFDKAVPKPTIKNLHVQLGCHLEEVVEMLDAITLGGEGAIQLATTKQALELLATALKTGTVDISGIDPKEVLDALADQIVTGVGVGHMLNLNVPEGLMLVNDSNWSKFVEGEPVFDENGKIAKGPDFYKPDLTVLAKEVLIPVA